MVEAKQKNPFLTRDAFFDNTELFKAKSVWVEEMGSNVRYKVMTMAERRYVREKSTSVEQGEDMSSLQVDAESMEIWTVITCCLQPESDQPLFSPDDFPAFETKVPAGIVSTVSKAIMADSGLLDNALVKSKEKTED